MRQGFGQLLKRVILLVVFLWSVGHNVSYPTDEIPPFPFVHLISQGDIEGLPKGYIHKPVQEQIGVYRRLYDPISAQRGGNFYKVNVEGLFDILANGIALVHDYIENTEYNVPAENWPKDLSDFFEKYKETNFSVDMPLYYGEMPYSDLQKVFLEEFKKTHIKLSYLKKLKKIYDVAVFLNNERKMTQYNFIKINQLMAFVLDEFKEGKFENEPAFSKFYAGAYFEIHYSEAINNLTDLEDNNLENIEFLFGLIKSSYSYDSEWWITYDYDTDELLEEHFFPPVIIYTNRKSSISYATFVDQILNSHYGVGLMLFDDQSFSHKGDKPGTKREPHYSKFNRTLKTLNHDRAHILEQYKAERFIKEKWGIDWRAHLQDINQKRLSFKETDQNAFKLLTNGLFLLSHELTNITGSNILKDGILLIWAEDKDNIQFSDIIETLPQTMKHGTETLKRNLHYKEDIRDFERALQGIYDPNGVLFLPDREDFSKLTVDEKQKTVSDGFARFWKYFLELSQLKS